MSEIFERWKNARCVFNGDFYSVTTYSGYRALYLDPLGGNHMLSPDTSDAELGAVVINALSNSRFISYESLGDFLDNEKRKERYDQWITEMMEFHRYRSKRQLFKQEQAGKNEKSHPEVAFPYNYFRMRPLLKRRLRLNVCTLNPSLIEVKLFLQTAPLTVFYRFFKIGLNMEQYISKERFEIYTTILKIQSEHVMAAYCWNKELSGSMIPALQCLEVTLRNAIDYAIRSYPPRGAKGLYKVDHNWIYSLFNYMGGKTYSKNIIRFKKVKNSKEKKDGNGYLLNKYGKRVIDKYIWEETQINAAKNKIIEENKILTPSRIISSLTFGFWTNLLSHKYEDKDSETLLWPNLLVHVFPYAPKDMTRKKIEDLLKKIKGLRNRISHHEAIWKFHYDDPNTHLPDYSAPVHGAQASCALLIKHYEDMLDMIGWISPERKDNFIKHHANERFYALCSVEGLNKYIDRHKR
ncbi:contact-dependent growth inhibition system immunity protein [Photorhabdus luminescens]|uniref:contact-dependent growth inhibition system immunity protein n=1 Tax=Photorhabdus luminescens TaxID=29488 RepID=UPI001594FCDB|nr:contact-dependent growth inhibition system immunity protein [Photorhabdus luminescens]